MQRTTPEIVLLIVAATVCSVVLATVIAIAVLAPQGINMEIVGYVYDVVKVMLGAVIGGLSVKIAGGEKS